MSAQKIIRRFDPCGCGCKGKDPWHHPSYRRNLHYQQNIQGDCTVHAYGYDIQMHYHSIAYARLPWGEGRLVKVVEVMEQGVKLGWFVPTLVEYL